MRRLAREQAGVTIAEAMIAGLLLVIGALATLQVFDASARNNFRAEESQVVVNRLQAELEKLREIPFAELAMSANPGTSADQNDPRWRVSGDNYAIGRNGPNDNPRPMVIDSAMGINPGPVPFEAGDISGEIWRFVVWAPDPACPDVNGCEDLKRIIVAATVNEAPISFERTFQEVQGDVANPDALPPEPNNPNPNPNPPPPSDEDAQAAFWLTDTPCSFSTRQPITADHPAHNTRGRCVDGLKTGDQRGAPDLMFMEQPALDPNYPPEGQPLYDYATDLDPEDPLAPPDAGLMMPWSDGDSCALDSVIGTVNLRKLLDGLLDPLPTEPEALDGVLDLLTSEPNKHYRTHTWLSPKVSNSGGVLTGDGRLELWTKSVNGASHPGEICVTLFVRQKVQVPVTLLGLPLYYVEIEADIPVVNTAVASQPTFFTYSQNPWPTDWYEIPIPLQFIAVDSSGAPTPLELETGSQIGLTIAVKKSGTEPGKALEFAYDHATYDSRLQLSMSPIIEFGGGT